MTAVDGPQTLDLIGQLLARSRRWELIGAFIVASFVFSAGGAVVSVRQQFDALKVNQAEVKKRLDDRTILSDAAIARVAETNSGQDASIRELTGLVTELVKRQQQEDAANVMRDRILTETASTQNQMVKLLDQLVSDKLGLDYRH